MTQETLPARATGRRKSPLYAKAILREFLERVMCGESQASIFRDPTMPNRGTVEYWVKTRPRFAERLRKARIESGHIGGGSASTYCPVTAQAIFRRLCEGESVKRLCDDPTMPCFSTVYLWRKRFPEFAEAMRIAREVQAERFCDEGWEMALAAAPETAYLTHVQLTQLRWMMGHMAPRTYGKTKPVVAEVEIAEAPEVEREEVLLVPKKFKVEEREDGWHRVVAFLPNPHTGQLERISPEDEAWHPPPPGRWRETPKRPAVDAAAAAAARQDDPEGWL